MTQQEKLNAILIGLHKQASYNISEGASFGFQTLIKDHDRLDENEQNLLGGIMHSQGLIEGMSFVGGYHGRLTPKGFEAAEWLLLDGLTFNIYLRVNNGSFNLFNLTKDQTIKVSKSYKDGLTSFTINHLTYHFKTIEQIGIFTNRNGSSVQQFKNFIKREYELEDESFVLTPELLSEHGKDVTRQFVNDETFGYALKQLNRNVTTYIHADRIEELRGINDRKFDLSKVIRICEELNDSYESKNYYTVGLLIRAIINHIPPIFGDFKTFDQFIAGYGSKSFKKTMTTLNESLRSIADGYTHQLIGKKEPLPNEHQIDYKANVDVLLSEIIVVLSS